MILRENILLLNRLNELNSTVIKYFFDRLSLFLLNDRAVPKSKAIFTGNKNILIRYYGSTQNRLVSFYDHETSTIVFNSDYYKIKSKNFILNKADFMNEYTYAIPVSTIYHELIHHFQYNLGSYVIDSFLEGSADILSYIITGYDDITYTEDCIALWYIGRKIFKYNLTGFYNFIVSIINNEDLTLLNRFIENKSLTKKLVKKYDGDWTKFFKNISKEYGDLKNLELMKKDLVELHNLIFYKY